MSRLRHLVRREWRDVMSRPGLVASMVVPIVLMTVLAVLALYAAGLSSARTVVSAQTIALSPFFTLWLVFPVSIPSTLAAHAIAGEKEEGTLEPLLATPVSTGELLLAKGLAASLPAIALGWVPWLVTSLAGRMMGAERAIATTLMTPAWIVGEALLAPGLTFLTVMVLVVVSSRVSEARTANQIGALLVVPLILAFLGQIGTGTLPRLPLVLGAAVAVWILGGVALAAAIRLFDREAILVRWKQSR